MPRRLLPLFWTTLWIGMLSAGVACHPKTGGTPDRDPSSRGTTAVAPLSPTEAFLDTLSQRTFHFFWDLAEPGTLLTPDRYPTRSFASISATGFALTAYGIGAERGYVTRDQAKERVVQTLRFLWKAPQNDSEAGAAGYRGFFYHFVHPETGLRFDQVELSTVDTALLLAGAMFTQSYFDRDDAIEAEIRALTDSLYFRVDWQWSQVRPPMIGHGWDPENGHLPYDWGGYNEAMLVYVLALASPTHSASADAWTGWTSRYRWDTLYGQEHLVFGPLFGHQYTHVWVDFRGIQDDFMRSHGIDYFENSRRATLAHHAYALENPSGWKGYGPRAWGLTACDGPVEAQIVFEGRERQFHTYWARGVSIHGIDDDGTLSPTAAGGSIAFAPEIVIPALQAMREDHGSDLFGPYGFFDAFNPTFDAPVRVQHGRVVPGKGWYDTDYLGIDQGPILAMLENHRSELVWKTMRKNPHLARGLARAGFTGGWLDSLEIAR